MYNAYLFPSPEVEAGQTGQLHEKNPSVIDVILDLLQHRLIWVEIWIKLIGGELL